LNLGVRYDWASNPTTVGEPVFVLDNLTTTATESSFVTAAHPFNSNPNVKNIDPRIGLAYDPFGDHKLHSRRLWHVPRAGHARTFGSSFSPNNPIYKIVLPFVIRFVSGLPKSLASMAVADRRLTASSGLPPSSQCGHSALCHAVQLDRAAPAWAESC